MTSRALILGCFAALLAVAAPAQKAADPLVGTFRNDEMTVVVTAIGTRYTGTIAHDGQKFPFSAGKQGENGLAGSFTDDGEQHAFAGELRDGILVLKSGETSYALRKEQPKRNPLDRGSAARAESAPKAESDWKLFKHPTGLSLRHPADWRIQEAPDGSGYLLLPPGVAPGGEEFYLVGGQAAGDIATAEDPRLAEAAEQLMAQAAPLLQRKGAAEKVRAAASPGISLAWESSQGARARMFVTILQGQAIGITGIGTKEKIAAREETLRKIFETLSSGEASLDRSLAGTWRRVGTTTLDARDNAGRLQASSAGDHHHAVQLRPDGSCSSRESSRTIAVGQGVAIDTGDQVTTKSGRWSAGEGKLVLTWDGEAPEEYGYVLSGEPGQRQLIIKAGPNQGHVWAESR